MITPDQVFAHIAEHQRPTSSPDLIETLYEAAGNGWTGPTLARALQQAVNTNAGTGAVVWQLRKFAANKPTNISNTPRQHRNHEPCDQHPAPCQLCWCHTCPKTCNLPHQHERTPTHHTSVPMPAWVRGTLNDALNGTRIPD